MKKAVSPLIATILLIVVAVALIAIVVAWGKSFTTDSLADASVVVGGDCIGSAIQATSCNIDSDGNMTFQIVNNGTKDFPVADDFIINVTDSTTGEAKLNLRISEQTGTTWDGLSKGETALVTIPDENVPTSGDSLYTVKVNSDVCSADAVSTIQNCSK